eukprot:5806736-Amphidinium_carterae.1
MHKPLSYPSKLARLQAHTWQARSTAEAYLRQLLLELVVTVGGDRIGKAQNHKLDQKCLCAINYQSQTNTISAGSACGSLGGSEVETMSVRQHLGTEVWNLSAA